jgi:hypothetical protein
MVKAAIFGAAMGIVVLLSGLILDALILYTRPVSEIPWGTPFMIAFCAFMFSTLGFRAGARSATRLAPAPTEK